MEIIQYIVGTHDANFPLDPTYIWKCILDLTNFTSNGGGYSKSHCICASSLSLSHLLHEPAPQEPVRRLTRNV